MILGSSKIWLKSGPVDFRITTKMLQRIQEKYGIIMGKDYLCESGTYVFVSKMYVLGTMCFLYVEYLIFRVPHFYIIFYEDEDFEMIAIALIQIAKAWI